MSKPSLAPSHFHQHERHSAYPQSHLVIMCMISLIVEHTTNTGLGLSLDFNDPGPNRYSNPVKWVIRVTVCTLARLSTFMPWNFNRYLNANVCIFVSKLLTICTNNMWWYYTTMAHTPNNTFEIERNYCVYMCREWHGILDREWYRDWWRYWWYPPHQILVYQRKILKMELMYRLLPGGLLLCWLFFNLDVFLPIEYLTGCSNFWLSCCNI